MVGLPIVATDPDGDWVRSHINFESGEEMEAFFEAFDYQKTPEGGRIVVREDSNLSLDSKTFYSVRVAIYDGKDAAGEPDLTDDDTTTDRSWVDAYFSLTIVVTGSEAAEKTHFQITARSTPEGSGTIILSGDGAYVAGSEVTVTTNPVEGFEFQEWLGDGVGAEDCALTMDSDKQVRAIFVQSEHQGWCLVASNAHRSLRNRHGNKRNLNLVHRGSLFFGISSARTRERPDCQASYR